MDPDPASLRQDWLIVGTLALVGVCAVFALLENALARLSRVDIKLLLERRRPRPRPNGPLAQLARGKFLLLVPLQLFVQLLYTVLGLTLYLLLSDRGQAWPFALTVLAMALALLLIRHTLPWAAIRFSPERVFLALLPLFIPFYYLLLPVTAPIRALIHSSNGGDQDLEGGEEEISDEEVQAYLDVGTEEGIFELEESQMIQMVMEFSDTIVREIMVPRTEIVAIPHTATLEELKDLIVHSRHSRIPVFRGNIDSILGVVYVRHLLTRYSPETRHLPVEEVAKAPFFVPETKNILDLLREMQNRGEQMAIIVDEYGGVAGLVTMEDLLEEIVGEIRDEDQVEDSGILEDGADGVIMAGDTELDEIRDRFKVDLYEDGYNTIAGIIIKTLGRFPHKDEVVPLKGVEVQVLEVDNRKIHRVRVCLVDAPTG